MNQQSFYPRKSVRFFVFPASLRKIPLEYLGARVYPGMFPFAMPHQAFYHGAVPHPP